MASKPNHSQSSRTSSASPSSLPPSRRPGSLSSSKSPSSSPTSPRLSPKVQLVPHSRTASFDVALTNAERLLLDQTNFDHSDLSSQDFDFEDIFTYDRPQKKLPKVVEVTTVARQRDWSNFSFSYYTVAMAARAKANRNRSGGISDKYLKNQKVHANGRKG